MNSDKPVTSDNSSMVKKDYPLQLHGKLFCQICLQTPEEKNEKNKSANNHVIWLTNPD